MDGWLLHLPKVVGGKGISKTKSKQQSPCITARFGLWCHGAMHAVHACIGLWCACISLWCHRPMHALTASWSFKFVSDIPLLQLLCIYQVTELTQSSLSYRLKNKYLDKLNRIFTTIITQINAMIEIFLATRNKELLSRSQPYSWIVFSKTHEH
jgi:hypothetical protein